MKTHLEYFYNWEKKTPDKIFLKQPYGNSWKTITYYEAGEEARKMVAALKKMGLKKRHIEQNVEGEPNEIDAITFSQLIKGYRALVNKCRLNQQDAFWGILLSESEEATSFLGADEAKRTMNRMVDEAFKQINNQWN